MKRTGVMMAFLLGIGVMFMMGESGCEGRKDTDKKVMDSQETLLAEAFKKCGMPAMNNFREMKLLKMIYELRDQEGLVTYTYCENMIPTVVKGHTACGGKFTFVGNTIGYPIPYATQYTSPSKVVCAGAGDQAAGYTRLVVPQADPNALFQPASSEATWVMMKDPNSDEVKPVYSEPRFISFPFKLPMD